MAANGTEKQKNLKGKGAAGCNPRPGHLSADLKEVSQGSKGKQGPEHTS